MLVKSMNEIKAMRTLKTTEDAIKLKRDQQTLESLKEYEVGELIDGDVVMAWLESWGTEDEKEPPIK